MSNRSLTRTKDNKSLSSGRQWTPLDIFRGSSPPLGFWYDPSDLSTLFQDTAGTVPVTAAGQPVGMMLDKSGNGLHIMALNGDSTRPILETDGRTFCLVFDGIDDMLYRTTAPIYNSGLPISLSMGVLANRGGTTGDQRYFVESSTISDRPLFSFQSNSASPTTMGLIIRYISPTYLVSTGNKGVIYDNVRRVGSVTDELGSVRFRVDGTVTGTSDYTRSDGFVPLDRLSVGALARTVPINYANFRLFGMICVANSKAAKFTPAIDKFLRRKI